MAKTIYVMPNPYGQLDAKGMLAGGCQMAEERRPGTALPANIKIGAELRMVDGTYDDKQAQLAKAVDGGLAGESPVVPIVYSRAERIWHFTATSPVALPVTPALEAFYVSRARRNGTPPCLLIAKGPDDLQLEALAGERLDAIARWDANLFKDDSDAPIPAPVEKWAAQFDLDTEVAELMPFVAKKREEAAKEAEEKATKLAEKASAAAKLRDEARANARKAAMDKARASLTGKAKDPPGETITTPLVGPDGKEVSLPAGTLPATPEPIAHAPGADVPVLAAAPDAKGSKKASSTSEK